MPKQANKSSVQPKYKYKYTVTLAGRANPTIVLADGFEAIGPFRYRFVDSAGVLKCLYEDCLGVTVAPNPSYKAPEPSIGEHIGVRLGVGGAARAASDSCSKSCGASAASQAVQRLRIALMNIQAQAERHNRFGSRKVALEEIEAMATEALVDSRDHA